MSRHPALERTEPRLGLKDPKDLPGPTEKLPEIAPTEYPDQPRGRFARIWRSVRDTINILTGKPMDGSQTTQNGRRKIIALVVGALLAIAKAFGLDLVAMVGPEVGVNITELLIGIIMAIYGFFSFRQAKASADDPNAAPVV